MGDETQEEPAGSSRREPRTKDTASGLDESSHEDKIPVSANAIRIKTMTM